MKICYRLLQCLGRIFCLGKFLSPGEKLFPAHVALLYQPIGDLHRGHERFFLFGSPDSRPRLLARGSYPAKGRADSLRSSAAASSPTGASRSWPPLPRSRTPFSTVSMAARATP